MLVSLDTAAALSLVVNCLHVREKGECRRLLEDLMRQNQLKMRECHKSDTLWMSFLRS
jgi:hypothetical protein